MTEPSEVATVDLELEKFQVNEVDRYFNDYEESQILFRSTVDPEPDKVEVKVVFNENEESQSLLRPSVIPNLSRVVPPNPLDSPGPLVKESFVKTNSPVSGDSPRSS